MNSQASVTSGNHTSPKQPQHSVEVGLGAKLAEISKLLRERDTMGAQHELTELLKSVALASPIQGGEERTQLDFERIISRSLLPAPEKQSMYDMRARIGDIHEIAKDALASLSKGANAAGPSSIQDERDAIWNEAVEACADAIPSSWLDRLLSGPEAVKIPEGSAQAIETLLIKLKAHIRTLKHSPKAGQPDPDIERMMKGDLR